MKLSNVLLITILCLVGSTAYAREFPLCLYGVNNPADIKLVKKAGFSCIQTYQTDPSKLDELAQEAHKRGMNVVFSPHKVWGSAYEQKANNWPMLAWYLVDEPDVNHWSREQVKEAHNRAKQTWPGHETTLVIGQGRTEIPFYDLPDAMMMDWYPVPHHPLTSFGDNVRYTKEGMARMGTADRPLWGVVQIFDWKEFKQHRPDHDRIGRFPTQQEIRFMSYDGIWNGATGLFYFIFTTKGKPLPTAAPAYWERVHAAVQELARLRPVLEKGVLTENPVTVQEPLRMKTWMYKKHRYSILLNASNQTVAVPAELLNKSYKPLYGTKKQTQLEPYGVWVLKKK